MNTRIIAALVRRDLRSVLIDRGRKVELVTFPLSCLVIWGLLYTSGVIQREVAGQLLAVNLIWMVSGQFQSQANLGLMLDLWSNEFAELFREGVPPRTYLAARVVTGTVIGLVNLAIFTAALPLLFGAGAAEVRALYETLPVYYVASMGVGFVVAGCILRFGRSYGFLAWTSLQFVMMLSSPYSPLDRLPSAMRYVALCSPYSYVFEYVRTGDFSVLAAGAVIAAFLFAGGLVWFERSFRETKAGAGLVSL